MSESENKCQYFNGQARTKGGFVFFFYFLVGEVFVRMCESFYFIQKNGNLWGSILLPMPNPRSFHFMLLFIGIEKVSSLLWNSYWYPRVRKVDGCIVSFCKYSFGRWKIGGLKVNSEKGEILQLFWKSDSFGGGGILEISSWHQMRSVS